MWLTSAIIGDINYLSATFQLFFNTKAPRCIQDQLIDEKYWYDEEKKTKIKTNLQAQNQK